MLPSEAAVNDSRLSVGSCYGKSVYAGQLCAQESQAS